MSVVGGKVLLCDRNEKCESELEDTTSGENPMSHDIKSKSKVELLSLMESLGMNAPVV